MMKLDLLTKNINQFTKAKEEQIRFRYAAKFKTIKKPIDWKKF